MTCQRCGWPIDETVVLSTHHTSQGWIRYRRCVCGAVSVQLVTLDEQTGTRARPVAQTQSPSAVVPRAHNAVTSTVRAV